MASDVDLAFWTKGEIGQASPAVRLKVGEVYGGYLAGSK